MNIDYLVLAHVGDEEGSLFRVPLDLCMHLGDSVVLLVQTEIRGVVLP